MCLIQNVFFTVVYSYGSWITFQIENRFNVRDGSKNPAFDKGCVFLLMKGFQNKTEKNRLEKNSKSNARTLLKTNIHNHI